MSKIGKQSINIPAGITFSISKDNEVVVKGPKGELTKKIDPKVSAEVKDNQIIVSVRNNSKKNYAIWGLYRTLIANMIEGVEKGFEKKLEIQGVGYKAIQKGTDLELSLGFSHLVIFKAPEGIKFNVEKNIITITGIDKQLVGQIAADIRSKKKPEPYKGKGIRYLGEQVRRKVGKKVAGTGE
ncbi:MAG: 50S ribosomal protein L6 [Candidatus Pacebacteria bacterium]|nr:50S ribosomal protein L6 [Candidatus Andersenbacteria bacterium]MCK4891117.1 50S ribosomal protein L6 [Candidatus Paceibacterota bacterium]